MSSEAYYHCPICKGKVKIVLKLGGRLFLVKHEQAEEDDEK